MILRSITRHVREQNWFAVALDFLIVVVGVFIGLQVANWNEYRVERELEQRYLERLHASLLRDVAEYDDAVRLAEHRRGRARLLLDALESDQPAQTRPSELYDAVMTAGFTYHPDIADAVFQEMVATGNARIIRDEALRDQIAAYYGMIDARTQWSYIREHTQLEYMDRRAHLLDAEESRRLWEGGGSAAFEPAEARALTQRIRESQAFREWLPYAESWQITQVRDYQQLGEVAGALLAELDRALQSEATP